MGRIGDVMIPNVIHDEHSQNTYLFDNCFSARNVTPHLNVGNVLDNQKAVTALGTFLQNPGYMQVFYHEGYTDIEMEGGPYLSAVYEAFRPKRHPVNEIVNLYGVPFDIGFLHYASDTPMKHGPESWCRQSKLSRRRTHVCNCDSYSQSHLCTRAPTAHKIMNEARALSCATCGIFKPLVVKNAHELKINLKEEVLQSYW
jgi:hypothetical protein